MESKFEVAVTGISGKFPECENVPSFKDALYEEKPLLTLRDERWPTNYVYKYSDQLLPAATGKINAIKEIDIGVFKLNNSVTECTCTSNRGVLEPVFEAIMDAGINPHDLSGRCIGIYTALHQCDTDANGASLGEGRLWVLGSSKTMMANRISFALNLIGPSMTFLHDINGSFLALNEAYKMVSEGHIEAAVVGVVSTVLSPVFGLHLASMNLLSRDSMTRVFDKNANGYGRSDAFVGLYLQRADDAKRIYCTIDFSGHTYHGSNPNSLLAYDQDVIKESLIDMYTEKNYAGYNDVGFVEMSASGLKRNDRIECNVIADVLCQRRKTPLLIGSVKSNVGNTEGAAPYVGLYKTIFAFESGSLLHNINLQQIDDDIEALANNKLKVVTKSTPLSSDKVAINSVGITGSLSQLIVKRNPKIKTPPKDNLNRLVLICGRTEDGTRNVITKLEQKTFDTDFISLVNDVFGTDMPFHTFRGYTILSPDPTCPKKNALDVKGDRNRPVWFLFSGMGSQWNLMGNGLLELPLFAETVRKCHDILKSKDIDIYRILTTDDPTIFDNIVHAFVGIITIQIGLLEILKALGIKADGIIGHSVGENACAYADGCLTLEQAVLSSYARGIASIETGTIKGMMAAVGKGYNEIKDSLPPNIEVACHNSASSCTLSGPAEDVQEFVQQLQEEKVFARTVNVSNIAYHSKYIAPAAPNLLGRLQKVIPIPVKRSSKWVSTSIPECNWNQPLAEYCSAEYLTNNLLNSVLFEEGCKHIPKNALVIEIAPHGLLQAILKRSLPDTCTNVSLTRRNNRDNNLENLLTAIGELYISGCDVNVNAIYPPTRYPVPRDTPSLAPLAVWQRTSPDAGVYHFNLTGSCASDPITIPLNNDSPYSYLKYHRIDNRIIFPISLFLHLTWWVYSMQRKQEFAAKPVIFSDIHLFKNIHTSLKKPRSFTIYLQKGTGTFEILKLSKTNEYKTTKVMTGVISQTEDYPELKASKDKTSKINNTITDEQFYNFFKNIGYELEDTFRGLQELSYNEKECYANVKWNSNWVSLLDTILKLSMFQPKASRTDLTYTKKIRKLVISPSQIQSMERGSTLLCYRNFITNEITCDGVFMSGIQNDRFTDERYHADVKVQGLRFISHRNPQCQSVAEFLNICLQIATDNVPTKTKQKNPKLNVIIESDDGIAKSLKTIVKDIPSMKSKIVFREPKDALSDEYLAAGNCSLIVTHNFDNIPRYTGELLLLLILTPHDRSITAELKQLFVEITRQRFAEITISLHKKVHQNYIEKRASKLDESRSTSTLIVKKSTNFDDLTLMLNTEKQSPEKRYVFIMDNEMPSDIMLKTQHAQNLPVTVWQNKEWGSYRVAPEEFSRKNTRRKNVHNLLIDDIQLQSIRIQYLCLDPVVAMEDGISRYNIEYSGLHVSGEKIMGLSLINTHEPVNQPDINLTWRVPKKWSLEDAATVPFIYASAYNILNLVRGMQLTHKILINIGNECSLAMACISLSLQRNHTIFVTVSNDQEAAFIKRKFPQIKSSQILDQRICNYEAEVLTATKGLGVDLVINCLPGMEHVNAMLNCVAKFGHCVEVVDLDNLALHHLDLRPFLKSVSFVIVPNKISTLLKLSDIDKRKLHDYVQEGIDAGIVVPFERDVQTFSPIEYSNESEERYFVKTIYKVARQSKLDYNVDKKIRYDNNHSYIIVGGEKKDTSWFELVEWMITKGARKFIVTVDNFFLGPKISHQMNRILNQKKATIILTSAQKVESTQDSIELVDEANNIAPLEAVFFISVQLADEKIRNMNLATQKKHAHVHFISIFSGGLNECEFRRYQGSPALVIHGKRPTKKLSMIFPHIDDVLEKFDNNNSPTLYHVIEDNYGDEKIHDFTVGNFLPSDIFTIESIGRCLTKDVEFVEVATLTPRLADVKGVTPVFIISTLGPIPLRGLFKNLLSPAFCAVVTHSVGCVVEAASKLYDSLNRIQSKEGVTLIAETWWSCVALEMIRLLERDGRQYRLFTIEGNPFQWKERIKALGLMDSSQFENNLITQVFKNGAKIPIYNNPHSPLSLEDKINAYLSKQSYHEADVRHLVNVINTIRNGLTLASKHEHDNNELVKNTVAFSQRTLQDDEMMNFSISSEIFVYEEDDYYKFISSKSITSKINDNILHNMWYCREH